MTEMVDLVDENDEIVRTTTRKEIINKKLLHRTTGCIIFNSKGKILVQKRSEEKDLFAGMYDLITGGVVQSGESYDEANKREVAEEVGIENVEYKYLFKIRCKIDILNSFLAVYTCVYDGELHYNDGEVVDAFFVSPDKLEWMIMEGNFCQDGVKAWDQYKVKNF